MAKPVIVVTRSIHEDAIARLQEIGIVRVFREPHPMPYETLLRWLSDANACLSMLTDSLDRNLLAHVFQLKIIATMAVGYNNIDIEAAREKNIMVTNTPDVLTDATADLTMALILVLMRRIISSQQALLDGRWGAWDPQGFLGDDLKEKTLGIVGLGRIGVAVARRAQAFGMPVIALARKDSSGMQDDIRRVPREQFLSQADVVSLHVPLNSDTYHMIDKNWLSSMQSGSYLINTARGAIVDELALKHALDSGHLKGAALDVFEQEPQDSSHILAAHPAVVATPHIGSATHQTRRAMAMRAAENIIMALSDEEPRDLLTPSRVKKNCPPDRYVE